MKKMILALFCVTGIGLYASQPPLQILKKETTDLCIGLDSSGLLTVTVTGGSPFNNNEYLFTIDDTIPFFEPSPMRVVALAAGLHSVTVADAQGEQLIETFSVGESEPLSLILTVVQNTCINASDGAIQVEVLGAETLPPLTYTLVGPGVSRTSVTSESTQLFRGLPAGLYKITVIGRKQCGSGSLNLFEIPAMTFPVLQVQNPLTCNGGNDGSILARVEGGTPLYTYSITAFNNPSPVGVKQNPLNPVNEGVDVTFSNLPADIYTILVDDARGCQQESNFIDISDPTGIVIDSIIVTDASCFGKSDGSIVINVTTDCNGGDIRYSIDDGTTTQISNKFLDLAAGTYNIKVTCRVNNDCAVGTGVVGQPDELTCSACVTGTTIEITAQGGVGDRLFSIDGGAIFRTSSIFEDLAAGTYEVQVKDRCATAACGTVEVNANALSNFLAQKHCPTCP